MSFGLTVKLQSSACYSPYKQHLRSLLLLLTFHKEGKHIFLCLMFFAAESFRLLLNEFRCRRLCNCLARFGLSEYPSSHFQERSQEARLTGLCETNRIFRCAQQTAHELRQQPRSACCGTCRLCLCLECRFRNSNNESSHAAVLHKHFQLALREFLHRC